MECSSAGLSCSFFFALFFALLVVPALGQTSQSFCTLSCTAVDPASLNYCAGIVNYTSCLSIRDLTPQAADARALNTSLSMQLGSNSRACLDAQKELLCSLAFPKCTVITTGPIISQPVCNNVCVNFFLQCNVTLTTQCDLTSGFGPANNCTGTMLASSTTTASTKAPNTASFASGSLVLLAIGWFLAVL